jgi:hypothetical protein
MDGTRGKSKSIVAQYLEQVRTRNKSCTPTLEKEFPLIHNGIVLYGRVNVL